MMIPIFGILCALGLVLVYFGGAYPEFTGATLLGFSVLFLLGAQLATGGLDYQNGSAITTTYTYTNATLTGTQATETFSYGQESYTIAGILLSVVGGLGFSFTLMNRPASRW